MVKVVEYGTYIIDISDAMMEHREGLNAEQVTILRQIRDSAQTLVTQCLQHESADLVTLYYFLYGKAPVPVTHMINHCDFMLRMWKLHPAYEEAFQNIRECSVAIRQELGQMKADLVGFMEKIGMAVPDRRYIQKPKHASARRSRKPDSLKNDPRMKSPSPVARKKPVRRLKPLRPGNTPAVTRRATEPLQ